MKKILFTTDFTCPALPMAVELSRLKATGLKEVIFLFVVDRDEVGFNVTTGFDSSRAAELTLEAASRFSEWRAVLEAEGIAGSHLVEFGSPEAKILEAAHELDADLIVVGREAVTPLDDFYPWGVSMKIIRRTARPVLVYKCGEGGGVAAPPFGKILFATDFSPASRDAALFLRSLAGTAGRIDAVHVHTEDGAVEGREGLARLCGEFAAAGITSAHQLLTGEPTEEILKLAAEQDYSMIALATTGRRGLSELLSGSVSHRVADRAHVPVLLVPPSGKIEEYA